MIPESKLPPSFESVKGQLAKRNITVEAVWEAESQALLYRVKTGEEESLIPWVQLLKMVRLRG